MEKVVWTADESRAYVEDMRKVYRYQTTPWVDRIARVLNDRGPIGKMADIGCGPGFLSIALALRAAPTVSELVFVDSADSMLRIAQEEARSKGVTCRAVHSVAQQLDIRDGSVDVALCKNVLPHVDDRQTVMEEMYRILTPGGTAFVIDFYAEAPTWRACLTWLAARLKLGRYRARRFWWAHTHAAALSEIVEMMKRAGFTQLSTEEHGVNAMVMAVKGI